MTLSSTDLREFKNLYLKEYKIKLSGDVANTYAVRLIKFVKVVYGDNLPSNRVLKEIVTATNARLQNKKKDLI